MFNPYDEFDKKTLELISKSKLRSDSNIYNLYLKFSEDSSVKSRKAAKLKDFKNEVKESASTIIFSVLSIETLLSEFITYQEFASSEIPEFLYDLRKENDPLRKWKKVLKYLEPELDLGESDIYEGFISLLTVRNNISHRNSRLLEANEYPDKLSKLIKQGIIPKPKEFRGSWVLTILNHETAEWAFEIGKSWIQFAGEYLKFEDP